MRIFTLQCFSGSPQISEVLLAMPFGLVIAARIFTKLMAIIGSYLRKKKI
jgi:hypothetical protein